MNWITDLSAALPARRDDEPPELRQRIVAEVRDHLECAYQRELLLTGDAAEAIRRVKEKFGDPARLARKLWFDALKEKIVSQRILVGMCAVLTATCLGMGTFLWRSTADAAAAAAALLESQRASQQAFLEQSREHNEKLLERLELLDSGRAVPPDDRADFKIELVKEGSLEPAEGCRVSVTAVQAGALLLEEVSGPAGIVDCGLVRGDPYRICVTSPFGLLLERDIFVRAGRQAQVMRIVVPSKSAPQFEVSFDIEWPDGFCGRTTDSQVGVLCQFEHAPTTIGEHGSSWQATKASNAQGWDEMSGTWFLKSGGKAVWIKSDVSGNFDGSEVLEDLNNVHTYKGYPADRFVRTTAPILRWSGAEHSLVVLGLAVESERDSDDWRDLWIAVHTSESMQANRRKPAPLQLREGELNRVRIELPDDIRKLIERSRSAAEHVWSGSDWPDCSINEEGDAAMKQTTGAE